MTRPDTNTVDENKIAWDFVIAVASGLISGDKARQMANEIMNRKATK